MKKEKQNLPCDGDSPLTHLCFLLRGTTEKCMKRECKNRCPNIMKMDQILTWHKSTQTNRNQSSNANLH